MEFEKTVVIKEMKMRGPKGKIVKKNTRMT